MKLKENFSVEINTPVKVEKNDWETYDTPNSRGLLKIYDFSSHKHLLYFLTEVIKELSMSDNIPVMEIRDMKVIVSIESSYISEVTDLEIRISKFIDEIYEDIEYL